MRRSLSRRRVGPAMPWALLALSTLLLVPTLVLTVRNASEDLLFVPVAVMMILGYSTVGAVLASRAPRNPIGWLMLAAGLLFVVTGLTDEYLGFAYASAPDGTALARWAALLSALTGPATMAIVPLIFLLFPTGSVPGRRWRPLQWVIVGSLAVFLLGTALRPGPLEDTGLDAEVANPAGVEALGSVADAAISLSLLVGILASLLAVVAVIMRYRSARAEERQQIRWVAYVVGLLTALILAQVAAAVLVGDAYGRSLLEGAAWLASFALIGIGIPVAMAVAMLKYRLYDLDLVVKKTVVFAILVALVMVVSLASLLALSSPLTDVAPDETQAVGIAMFLVGVSVWPLWRLARRIADRVVYGGRATPYEVLAGFVQRVGGTYSSEDVLPRMAQILGEATGADVARVWLRVGNEFRPAAAAPSEAERPSVVRGGDDGFPLGEVPGHAVEVRHQGELLGALEVELPANDPMGPAKERIVRDLAAHAGLVLRNVRLIEELRESRRRIVAAQDDRAKKLERDIHDGAQQQLVALSVKARLAANFARKDADRTAALLDELQRDLGDALENLRDLARGIYPPLLADRGLAAALEAQARKVPVPVSVEPDGLTRFSPDVEAGVYFSVLEALQNAAKYAEATSMVVRLDATDGELRFEVTDDGHGFDPSAVAGGTGLQGIADRLSALGGELEIRSAPGRGTTILGRVPSAGDGAP